MLYDSELLLDKLPAQHEEFDRAAWLESAGVCALHCGQLDPAIERLRESLDALPPQWTARRIFVVVGLAGALAGRGDRDAAFMTAQTAISPLRAMQARELTMHFVNSLRRLLPYSHRDTEFEAFIADADRAVPADD